MEYRGYDRLIKSLWQNEIKNINDHLPKNRKLFLELLSEDRPSVATRDGGRLVFDKEELKGLDVILSSLEREMLKLPIVLVRRLDLGSGVYAVSGSSVEIDVISKMLRQVKMPTDLTVNAPYVYKPVVFTLKRRYRTCLVLGFSGASSGGVD